MKLETKYFIEGVNISISKEDKNDITKKVKMSNKRGQKAQRQREHLEDNFMRVAQIERKKDKKANFFNKHKKQ